MNGNNHVLNIKRGYLKEDFIFFHLKEKKQIEFEFHYHDFNKIVIFISGKVTYLIEGKAYELKPWDILFVSNNEVHKPLIDPEETYERIVIWINSKFLEKHNTKGNNLMTCFELASSQKCSLLRLSPELLISIKNTMSQLEAAYKGTEFGNYVLKNALFLQVMVYLNRLALRSENNSRNSDIKYDENIDAILNYINTNLNSDLSLDKLSDKFYMSKYYLMHKFKKYTGYTIYNYIMQKRIIMANNLIKGGKPITEACFECGFGDYSSFLKAFKKIFGASPKQYYKALKELE
ncbi:AraC family transcriptional regulator [Clostridium aciditolerans]|uniref:Helix-turn-helix domain-containing protein n=1 Tax=Clostridium aciditolerans TaxID=339861 RepID=A0A934HUI5_9CLOT|nr:AraC family transcriptional regulator [Clostridium aciditolerans]MBI6872179.1 helix-turn-helix domain-containing protein [Clostridium aciditolerans]